MTKEEALFEEVELYLHQQMDSGAKKSFEIKLLSDTSLQEKLKAHQIVEELIAEMKLKGNKELLLEKRIKEIKNDFYKNITIGTCVVLFTLVAGLWFVGRQSTKQKIKKFPFVKIKSKHVSIKSDTALYVEKFYAKNITLKEIHSKNIR